MTSARLNDSKHAPLEHANVMMYQCHELNLIIVCGVSEASSGCFYFHYYFFTQRLYTR